MGNEVLLPDILLSEAEVYTDADGCIRFGFQDIKGIKNDSARYIVQLRDKYDDSISTRSGLEECLLEEQETWSKESKLARKEQRVFKVRSPKQTLQSNKIDALESVGVFDPYEERLITTAQKQALEEELLGVALTDLSPQIFANNCDKLEDVDSYQELNEPWVEDIKFTLPGVITFIKTTKTVKDKKPMGIVTIGYEGEEAEFAVFPRQWKAYKFLFAERNVGIFTLKRTARGLNFDEGIKLS